MNLARGIIRIGILRPVVNNRPFSIRTYATTVDTGEKCKKNMEKIHIFILQESIFHWSIGPTVY